jgi:hypothetical protein
MGLKLAAVPLNKKLVRLFEGAGICIWMFNKNEKGLKSP